MSIVDPITGKVIQEESDAPLGLEGQEVVTDPITGNVVGLRTNPRKLQETVAKRAMTGLYNSTIGPAWEAIKTLVDMKKGKKIDIEGKAQLVKNASIAPLTLFTSPIVAPFATFLAASGLDRKFAKALQRNVNKDVLPYVTAGMEVFGALTSKNALAPFKVKKATLKNVAEGMEGAKGKSTVALVEKEIMPQIDKYRQKVQDEVYAPMRQDLKNMKTYVFVGKNTATEIRQWIKGMSEEGKLNPGEEKMLKSIADDVETWNTADTLLNRRQALDRQLQLLNPTNDMKMQGFVDKLKKDVRGIITKNIRQAIKLSESTDVSPMQSQYGEQYTGEWYARKQLKALEEQLAVEKDPGSIQRIKNHIENIRKANGISPLEADHIIYAKQAVADYDAYKAALNRKSELSSLGIRKLFSKEKLTDAEKMMLQEWEKLNNDIRGFHDKYEGAMRPSKLDQPRKTYNDPYFDSLREDIAKAELSAPSYAKDPFEFEYQRTYRNYQKLKDTANPNVDWVTARWKRMKELKKQRDALYEQLDDITFGFPKTREVPKPGMEKVTKDVWEKADKILADIKRIDNVAGVTPSKADKDVKLFVVDAVSHKKYIEAVKSLKTIELAAEKNRLKGELMGGKQNSAAEAQIAIIEAELAKRRGPSRGVTAPGTGIPATTGVKSGKTLLERFDEANTKYAELMDNMDEMEAAIRKDPTKFFESGIVASGINRSRAFAEVAGPGLAKKGAYNYLVDQVMEGDFFKSTKFDSFMNKIPDEVGYELFGPKDWTELKQLHSLIILKKNTPVGRFARRSGGMLGASADFLTDMALRRIVQGKPMPIGMENRVIPYIASGITAGSMKQLSNKTEGK